MKLRDCIFLLPNQELDGFPRTLAVDPARDLLGGWIALWHPLLIAAAQSPPRWLGADQLPTDPQDILFVLPELSEEKLELGAEDRIAAAGGRLLRPHQFHQQESHQAVGSPRWRVFQAEILNVAQAAGFLDSTIEPNASPDQPLPSHNSNSSNSAPPCELLDELLSDFAALGYAFLQIQLLTRQLRYTSNLDLILFGQQLTEAATATIAGDREVAERMLQSCFDALGQERDHYYSLDVNLIDVTLLAETTLGKSLSAQLTSSGAANGIRSSYLACGGVIRKLGDEYPAHRDQLQQSIASHHACLMGGLDIERAHPLLTRESIARDLERGRDAYLAGGFEPPRVFARSSFGLLPDSVAMLRRWGFEGCFLTAWAGGSYPQGSQAKISWEAFDGTFLATLAAPILDASDPSSFLALGWAIGEVLDHQHVPTIVFAHWPHKSCEFAALLAIVARRTPALGKWRLADEYFEETDQPYHQERLNATDFRYNWLLEAPNPSETLRATQQFHMLHCRCRSLQNLFNLAYQLEKFHQVSPKPAVLLAESNGDATAADDSALVPAASGTDAANRYRALPLVAWAPELADLTAQVDGLLDAPGQYRERADSARAAADTLRTQVLDRLAKQLNKTRSDKSDKNAAGGAMQQHPARLLVNPRSAPTRVYSHTSANQHFATDGSWYFADGRVGENRATGIDVPSCGFVIAPLHDESRSAAPKQRPLAAGELLCNEFLEAQIDPQRGHLRSLHIPAKRGNRLSLLIARRDQNSATNKPAYSQMIATDVRMLTSSNVCGLIRAVGRLEMDGETVAKFQIDYETWRGSRIVEIAISLHDLSPLASSNPWLSAYTLRLAWPTEAAILRNYTCGSRYQWSAGRAVAPTLIEVDEVDYRTHYLSGGLAFHRRTEDRFLESILAVDGEREVYHRIGIGVDLPHPIIAASQFMEPAYELPVSLPQPLAPASGWLISVNTRSVVADIESPLVDDHGNLIGVRLFLNETEGKSTNAKIRLLREIESANRVDYLGGKIGKLTTEGDSLTIAIRSNEQVNVDVFWK